MFRYGRQTGLFFIVDKVAKFFLACSVGLGFFRAKAFTASAIMCRKALEGICSAHGVKSGKLSAELQKLKEKGVIESRLFEWAEELRTMGNQAAHGEEFVVSREDARDTLEFTEVWTVVKA